MADLIQSPLTHVDSLFATAVSVSIDNARSTDCGVPEYFRNALASSGCIESVRNYIALPNQSLVRLRCMVQDTFSPEIYMGMYSRGGVVSSCKYRDSLLIADGEVVQDERPMDRQTLHCISVPAESAWSRELVRSRSHYVAPATVTAPAITNRSPVKRGRENAEEQEQPEDVQGTKAVHVDSTSTEDTAGTSMAGVTTAQPQTSGVHLTAADVARNFPTAEQHQVACLVKVYDSFIDHFKIGDVLDVIGVLSMDDVYFPSAEDDFAEEALAHRPPPSLIPRLHAVLINSGTTYNPLLDAPAQPSAIMAQLTPELPALRACMIDVLSHALGGDRVAAEYTLLNILSHVFLRPSPTMALGKFVLNLSHVASEHVQCINHVFGQLLPLVYSLPMSIQCLQSVTMNPRKDYDLDRINAGLLQLVAGTFLVLDETALQAGTMNEAAIINIRALAALINSQVVEYDFKFYTKEFPVDVPVLILSEGRSLLPADAEVPIHPTIPAVVPPLAEDVVTKLRLYLALVRTLKVEIGDAAGIESDFHALRLADSSFTPQDLERYITLSKLLAASYCQSEITPEIWQNVKSLEAQRAARKPSAPPPSL